MRDPHRILGIEPGAGPDAIKRAYRSLARRYHPDATGDAASAERFAEISAAYEQLLKKRADTPTLRGRSATHAEHPSDEDLTDPAEVEQVYDAFFTRDAAHASHRPAEQARPRTPFIRRRGTLDLELEVPISEQEARLGGEVRLPSARTSHAVGFPPGTETGDTARVPAAGIRGKGGARGDLIVRFRVVKASGDPLDLGL